MKNGKLFSKFSVIDAVMVVIVLLLIVVVCVRLGFFATPDKAEEQVVTYDTEQALVTLRFSAVSAFLKDEPFAVGDSVYQTGKYLGTVESFEKQPWTATETMEDGTSVTVEYSTAYTYIVKVKATLTDKDNFWRSASDIPITVGNLAVFHTWRFAGNAAIFGVEKIQ